MIVPQHGGVRVAFTPTHASRDGPLHAWRCPHEQCPCLRRLAATFKAVEVGRDHQGAASEGRARSGAVVRHLLPLGERKAINLRRRARCLSIQPVGRGPKRMRAADC
eukprot:365321-Chlamydomonas_euryale.AAC.21